MLLDEKTAVITGAASGIGKATAKVFAEHGAQVVLADIDEGGEETLETIISDGGEASFIKTDVSDPVEVQNAIITAGDKYGGLDVLFNNAGILGPYELIHEYDEAGLDNLVDVHFKGVFYGLKFGIQAMQADGGGSIISTSSIAARRGLLGRAAYGGVKAGIDAMSRSAAMEVAEDDIRVNTILPGVIETPMLDISSEEKPSQRFEVSEPLPGTGHPNDIANAALFLASDLANRITGVNLPVDGGYLARP